MQIFVTSVDPVLCAQVLDNKRLCKQIVESAQLLSNYMWYHNLDRPPYRPAFMNHPISQWIFNYQNVSWALWFFDFCIGEYEYRWNKKNHKCKPLVAEFNQKINPILWRKVDFCNCSFFKDLPVFDAYKLTLKAKWQLDKYEPKWTKRKIPEWAKFYIKKESYSLSDICYHSQDVMLQIKNINKYIYSGMMIPK